MDDLYRNFILMFDVKKYLIYFQIKSKEDLNLLQNYAHIHYFNSIYKQIKPILLVKFDKYVEYCSKFITFYFYKYKSLINYFIREKTKMKLINTAHIIYNIELLRNSNLFHDKQICHVNHIELFQYNRKDALFFGHNIHRRNKILTSIDIKCDCNLKIFLVLITPRIKREFIHHHNLNFNFENGECYETFIDTNKVIVLQSNYRFPNEIKFIS